MEDLEYKIGKLDIDFEYLKSKSCEHPHHMFVVELKDNIASIYIKRSGAHKNLVRYFELDKTKIVGGGDLILDNEKRLLLDDFSADYDTIPKKIKKIFGELILPELKKQEVEVNGIAEDIHKHYLNSYWQYDFEE